MNRIHEHHVAYDPEDMPRIDLHVVRIEDVAVAAVESPDGEGVPDSVAIVIRAGSKDLGIRFMSQGSLDTFIRHLLLQGERAFGKR